MKIQTPARASLNSRADPPTRRDALLLLVGSAMGLTSCGGGGVGTSLAGVSSGGTGSFTSGTIVGFGSVIVNGVRYNDANAKVNDVDGDDHTGQGALKLGMVVAVDGGAKSVAQAGLNYTAEAAASRIAFLTELKGPVSGVDVVALTVLGQRVRQTLTTVVDGAVKTFAAITPQHEVEVYGIWDDFAQEWQATRIEVSVAPPSFYRLAGEVSDLSMQTRTLRIGGQSVDFNGLSLDAAIGNGSRVRAVLNPGHAAGTAWVATAIRLADLSATPLVGWSSTERDGQELELEGVVSGLIGQRFKVQGVAVDGTGVSSVGSLTEGARVEVKGQLSGATLVAREIKSKSDRDRSDQGFELHGVISASTASDFMLRGFTITYDSQTIGAENVVDGRGVEAKVALQADGTWRAIKIEVDGDATSTGSSNDHEGEDSDSEDEDDGD